MEGEEGVLRESPKSRNQSLVQEADKTCRICYEPESGEDLIITPCECSGSMKYIHEKCLKTWILSKTKDPKAYACDICKYAIKMELKLKTRFSTANLKKELYKFILLPLFISIVSMILTFVSLTLLSSSNSSVSITGRVYLSIVFAVCTIIIIILCLFFYKTVKIGCFEVIISEWNIMSNTKQVELEDITNLTEHFDKKGEKTQFYKVSKYAVDLDSTQFMIRNLEVELPRTHSEIFLNDNPMITPRLPNEVESDKSE